MADYDSPVLIVGGSLVGMSTALLLGHYGVRALVVEHHRGTAIPRRAVAEVAGGGAWRVATLRHRRDLVRHRRRRRDGDHRAARWWRQRDGPRVVPGRGRRRAQPDAAAIRDRDARTRRVLEQRDDL